MQPCVSVLSAAILSFLLAGALLLTLTPILHPNGSGSVSAQHQPLQSQTSNQSKAGQLKADKADQENADSQQPPQPDPVEQNSTACGDIIDNVNLGYAYHYASDAYECLISVPFHAEVATRFIKYINTTVQFQSTLAYLKDPPPGYQQPPIDVLAGLQTIQNNITAGYYRNQYDFEIALQHLLYKTHDAHLYLTAGVSAAFRFLAPFSITAASPDGKSLPKVYITADILASQNGTWTPSAIKTINGQDAVAYLKTLASLNSFGGVEPHADWNQLFSMPGLDIQGDRSIWDGYINFYPGDELTLTVENGTEYEDFWLALYTEPYATGPLRTGGDFYNYFVLGLAPASLNDTDNFFNPAYTPADTTEPDNNETTTAVHSWNDASYGAYPNPDVAQDGFAVLQDGVVSGYFLHDKDAAVLSLPTFGQTGYSIGNFSLAVAYFINNVTDANITRVVIDLQQNRGGTAELAFDVFRRFFPDVDPFAESRRRNHQLGTTLGETYTTYFDDLTTDDPRYSTFLADEWVITPRLNARTGQNFTSWTEYYGPVRAKNDSFTLTERYNMTSPDFGFALFDGWFPLGYAADYPLSYHERPFDADKIVLLTDGACSSTCALMAEMFAQAGVKTTVAGGAPSTGPMQAIGGNRGAAQWSSDDLDRHINLLNVSDPVLVTETQLNDDGQRDSGVFTNVLGVNLRDQIRPNDTVPLQFKYEAADCRIYYTLANVYNMSRLWRDVVSASFDDKSRCVEGSTGQKNSSKPVVQTPRSKSAELSYEPASASANGDTLTFHLSGGMQDLGKRGRSVQITTCGSGNTCNAVGSKCQSVKTQSCKTAGKFLDVLRCVPITQSGENCPLGTTWEKVTKLPAKTATSANKKNAFEATGVIWTGPCTPNTLYNEC